MLSMSFPTAPSHTLDELTEGDISLLVSQQVGERNTLEYKAEAYGTAETDHLEILRDISSMANASGGYLLIGIATDGEGIPSIVVGLDDAEIQAQRLINISLPCIDPRIPGLATKCVLLSSGRHVVVLHIPKSHRAPHMISKGGKQEFWVRHDRRKDRMTREEIAHAFSRATSINKNLQDFLHERSTEIDDVTPSQPMLVIYVTPVVVLDDVLSATDRSLRRVLADPRQLDVGGWKWDLEANQSITSTFNGMMRSDAYRFSSAPNKVGRGELELFRNGHIEARIDIVPLMEESSYRGRPFHLHQHALATYVTNTLFLAYQLQRQVGLEELTAVSITLANIKGWALGNRATWPRAHVKIPPLQVSSLGDYEGLASILCDRIWQAFRIDRCDLFVDGKLRAS